MRFTIFENQVISFGTLYTSFSNATGGEAGWFYGDHSSLYPYFAWSNADVLNLGPDPRPLQSYLHLDFTDTYVLGREGDTILFKGAEGYGSFFLESFDVVDSRPQLTGTWTYQSFPGAPIPEPSGFALLAIGLVLTRLFRRGNTSRAQG